MDAAFAFESLETSAADVFDNTRFASMIRTSVRDVVEGALTKVPGRVDTRQEIRAAGERLGDALVAHADAAQQSATVRGANASTASAGESAPDDDSNGRSRAFRVMAGVAE
jgi:hypothetical protein